MATITKEQILKLETEVKAHVKENGGSFCDKIEAVLLDYENVYTDSSNNVIVRLANGNHVDLYEII